MNYLTGQRVQVYWNLNKKCWSLRTNRKVVAHPRCVVLNDVVFKVSEAGRRRVLRTRRKNVHAFAEGILTWGSLPMGVQWVGVSYNPYLGPTFYRKDNGEGVRKAEVAYFEDGRVLTVKPGL